MEDAATHVKSISLAEHHEALTRVLSSSAFHRSQRLRRFLSYVVEWSLENENRHLSEQQIGVAIFKRRPSYDTGADNIVRVTATELRKRLDLFYSGEGADETIIIEIPRGAYHPEFHRRPQNLAAATQLNEGNLPSTAAVNSVAATSEVPPAIVPAISRRPASSRFLLFVFGLTVLLLLSAGTVLYQSVRIHELEQLVEPWQHQSALKVFWQNFFVSRTNTFIVLADTAFAMAQDVSGYRLTLDDYLSLRYQKQLEQQAISSENGKSTNAVFALLASRSSGSIGDFLTAKRILDLQPRTSSIQVKFARDFSGEELRHNSTILIGSTRSNPWVEPFQQKLFYHMQPSKDGRGIEVRLSNPHRGEQDVYATSSSPNRTDGFCILAFLPGLNGESKTLIIAGTDSQATEAGGDFLTQETSLELLLKKLDMSSLAPFQVLLRTSRVAGSPLSAEIISVRRGAT